MPLQLTQPQQPQRKAECIKNILMHKRGIFMKNKLSIQAFSIGSCMGTLEETKDAFKKLASYGFTGVQTAGKSDNYTYEEYADALKEAGLECVGTHVGLDLLKNTKEAVRIHKILGTTNAGVGGMPIEPRYDRKALADFINDANMVGEQLSKYGMKFTYHNHSFEFNKVGNDRIFDVLVNELDPKNTSFVLDTCWVNNAGENVCEWIEKLKGRIDIIHLKDRGLYMENRNDMYLTELGAGILDFPKIIKVAKDCGVSEFCYEQDGNHRINPLESAKESAEYYFSIVE